jgi:peptidoglycan/xylan/chitin deacetylase (PgdA/CDA1 family)
MAGMDPRVLLTIDTELFLGRYRQGEDWQANFALSVEPAGVGLSYQLGKLARHGLKAVFFVDPMPALVYGIEPIRAMVDPILAAGQEIQLHLHPAWDGVARGEVPVSDLSALPGERQRELIAVARHLLREAGASEPIAFRAGSFAANLQTLEALASLGIGYDSSHNGSHHPLPSALPLDPRQISPALLECVVEIPVTQIEQKRGLRHLQLCAVSYDEIRDALLHAAQNGHPVINIVSHCFELATRDGRRPNPVSRGRFDKLCRFLDENRDRFATVHFSDLETLPFECDARPLPPRTLRTVARLVEQAWGNAVYERRF